MLSMTERCNTVFNRCTIEIPFSSASSPNGSPLFPEIQCCRNLFGNTEKTFLIMLICLRRFAHYRMNRVRRTFADIIKRFHAGLIC